MKVCKYARGHLVPEQRGRLIGKGPLPKEKLMKALGEVSSHCEIFYNYVDISAIPDMVAKYFPSSQKTEEYRQIYRFTELAVY